MDINLIVAEIKILTLINLLHMVDKNIVDICSGGEAEMNFMLGMPVG